MKHKHVYPWWAGFLLVSPLRKLSIDPVSMLGDYISEGMTVIDAGCAMGFFSLPAARFVGDSGKVICVDIQEKMLTGLKKRAEKAGLEKRIKTRLCKADWLMVDEYSGRVDVAIAFGVIHEARDGSLFISDLERTLKSGGTMIIGEPGGTVNAESFSGTLDMASRRGGLILESLTEKRSHRIAVFRKC